MSSERLHTDEWAEVDAHIAMLEDESGIAEVVAAHYRPRRTCPGCGGSGDATTYDGRSLGICDRCKGSGSPDDSSGEPR